MNELVLRDIRLPAAVLWWPPALGWWLLLVVLIVLCFIGLYLWQQVRYPSIKKQAQHIFKQIKNDFHQHQDERRLLIDLSALLRRIVMSYQGRQQIASLTGDAWFQRVAGLVKVSCFNTEQQVLLMYGQYASAIEIDSPALISSCERWIKALPRR